MGRLVVRNPLFSPHLALFACSLLAADTLTGTLRTRCRFASASLGSAACSIVGITVLSFPFSHARTALSIGNSTSSATHAPLFFVSASLLLSPSSLAVPLAPVASGGSSGCTPNHAGVAFTPGEIRPRLPGFVRSDVACALPVLPYQVVAYNSSRAPLPLPPLAVCLPHPCTGTSATSSAASPPSRLCCKWLLTACASSKRSASASKPRPSVRVRPRRRRSSRMPDCGCSPYPSSSRTRSLPALSDHFHPAPPLPRSAQTSACGRS